jgi:flagellum-specific ATP synthase
LRNAGYALRLESIEPARRVGHVRRIAQGHVEATGPLTTVGEMCEIACRPGASGEAAVLAEVVAVEENHIVLIPLDPTASILPDAMVTAKPARSQAPVGNAFGGRAVDAFGDPIDGGPPILPDALRPIEGQVMAPMERLEPNSILETGIRALDGPLTIGRGQRIGIFAASGVGKTTLMRQLAAQVACDRCVLCLVGERGREVETTWSELSGGQSRYTCVAATSDLSAALRARAVRQALCLSEYWRSRGEHVLLIVDSVTRFAMALREIGLAAGAPPTLRAYTPNVFAALPRLVERCGAAKDGGSITAVITVLSETDDVDDPITEVMKSLLDGHIILSRQLAEQGHFPAIDLTRSVSRQSEKLMSANHAAAARRATSLLATYEESRLMIESGIYKSGTNPRIDEAIRGRDNLLNFLKQRSTERAAFADTLRGLQTSVAGGRAHA